MAVTPPPTAGGGTDWTAEVTDRIVTTIDKVRDKTTVPVTTAARGLVYGLIAGVAGVVGLLLLLVLVLRFLYVYVGNLPWVESRTGRSVWLVDLFFGIVLSVAGLLFLRKGRQAPEA